MPRLRAAALLVLITIAAPIIEAKKRNKAAGDRVAKLERHQCEEGPCSEWDADLKPNCVMRCQSEACYESVFGEEELEPGEVDSVRSNKFQQCLRKEKSARLAVEREMRRARRGR
mmetsp:Transcript_9570/g.24790  ORF Transcript_9570/g.24790 Transcript_9570/m.24790 type:complete len:115 (+) Transcript_9570:56-400(+)|eukprot:CAMPEP_0119414126 /NCGR_PEP_ID=MMETSP1335-20130426/6538_1 /TAXON_ID=259385 /ORGANISM="Chrysoculter rhomboideus, Strain RCC1486" /LENGTH=114 /DNA_ID=CAMNT_0007438981 /DNA_START=23 /DNA_END=367 /DNA_ORIENTATION=+